MVERLRHAIEKARAQRGEPERASREETPGRPENARPAPAATSAEAWLALEEVKLDADRLAQARIITREKSDQAHVAFDLLRTRMLKVLRDNNWRTVAITSPTKGCGKTVVAANLAFSLARQPDVRTVLIDMDLRVPGLAKTLRQRDAPQLTWFLNGRSSIETALIRVGANLALGLNAERVRDSTELIQDDRAATALTAMKAALAPDVVIYDLPPMLVSDDALAFLPQADCVLLVAAAGHTTAQQIEECERQFSGQANFLGVLLNKAETAGASDKYDYV